LQIRPFADWNTDAWPTGVVAVKSHGFQVDPHLPSGRYALTLALADEGESIVLAHLRVEPQPRAFEPPEDVGRVSDVRFGDEFQLLGYDLVQEHDILKLTLHWRALRRSETSYKVFVHLFDPATGAVVTQRDAVPRGSTYPTTWWEEGEVVSDEVSLPIADVPGGRYRLGVGFYVPDTGERLPVTPTVEEYSVPGRLVLLEEIIL
jgi:hypothetical protein